MTTPFRRVDHRQGQIGGLRLLSPWTLQWDGYHHNFPLVPMRVGRNNRYWYGDNEPTTTVDPDEYIVRIGAHYFATKYIRHLKRDWWKDVNDLFRFYQFLSKMADHSMGSIVVDDTIFTNGETQNYVLALEWPPHGRTNMGGHFGGYWAIFRGVTDDVDQITDPGKFAPTSFGVYPYPQGTYLDRELLHDPRNQEDFHLPTAQRLPYGSTKLKRLNQILQTLDWSDRDADPYRANVSYEAGRHIDSRFGAAALGWMNFIPSHLGGNHGRPLALQHPAVKPALTKRVGEITRPLKTSEFKFEIFACHDTTGAGHDGSVKFGDPTTNSGTGGNQHAMGTFQGLHFRLTNISGTTLNMKGVIPLKTFSWASKMWTETTTSTLNLERWSYFWNGSAFGGL